MLKQIYSISHIKTHKQTVHQQNIHNVKNLKSSSQILSKKFLLSYYTKFNSIVQNIYNVNNVKVKCYLAKLYSKSFLLSLLQQISFNSSFEASCEKSLHRNIIATFVETNLTSKETLYDRNCFPNTKK